jgi:hypothetical protein
MCGVTLNAWEESDNAVEEHLGHSSNCGYARAIGVSRGPGSSQEPEHRDPMSDDMVGARQSTFTFAGGWPHESKKGWKCKIAKMVEAGWSWDPNPNVDEANDGVTCFYCDLSLDGWEPKDDPLEEHKRRSPHCRFFELLEHNPRSSMSGKNKKSTKRGKASIRSSTASKAGRLSSQSILSEVPSTANSFSELDTNATMSNLDESSLSIATTQSEALKTIKKKPARTKTTAKGSKIRKTSVMEDFTENNVAVQYPDLGLAVPTPTDSESEDVQAAAHSNAKSQKSRQVGTKVKAPKSVNVEFDPSDAAVPKKKGRSRKAQSQSQPEDAWVEHSTQPATPNAYLLMAERSDEVANQLHDELEYSMEEPAEGESTTIEEATKPKLGMKRTSDGRPKSLVSTSGAAQIQNIDGKPAAPAKRGRKPKPKPSEAIEDDSLVHASKESASQRPSEGKAVKTPKEASKTKKKSSASSKADLVFEQEIYSDQNNNDEAEIELELERIAADENLQDAIAVEHGLVAEFEASPLQDRISKDSQEIRALEREIHTESHHDRTIHPALVASHLLSQPYASPSGSDKENDLGSSPQYSDKENEPQSAARSLVQRNIAAVMNSPSKPSKIPLAPGTPNRSPVKPRVSPSKQISHLSSTVPWSAVDLDVALTASPQPTPGRLSQQLAVAAGILTSPEKSMSVEEWIRYRAEQSEAELRRRCEQKVAAFETEGLRALQSLNGMHVLA